MLVVAFQWDQHAGHCASLIVAPVRAPHSKQGRGRECCIARGEMCEFAFGLAARRATYPCKVDMVKFRDAGWCRCACDDQRADRRWRLQSRHLRSRYREPLLSLKLTSFLNRSFAADSARFYAFTRGALIACEAADRATIEVGGLYTARDHVACVHISGASVHRTCLPEYETRRFPAALRREEAITSG